MTGTTIITLSRAYGSHGRTFDTVELRAPRLGDFFAIGEPVELQPAGEAGGTIVVEHLDRIEAYRDRLVVKPDAADVEQLDLVDAMAIKESLLGFFTAARRARQPATSSAGAPANRSPTSPA